jgi:hypothetical protein
MRALVCLLTLVAACGNSSSPIPRCIPGSTEACLCASGSMGRQVCQGDGTYEACACSPASVGDGGISIAGDGGLADGGTPPTSGGIRVLDATGALVGYLVDTSRTGLLGATRKAWLIYSQQHDVLFYIYYDEGRILDAQDGTTYWSGNDCTGNPMIFLGREDRSDRPSSFVDYYRFVGTALSGTTSSTTFLYQGEPAVCRSVSFNQNGTCQASSNSFRCRVGVPTTILPTSWPAPLRLSL